MTSCHVFRVKVLETGNENRNQSVNFLPKFSHARLENLGPIFENARLNFEKKGPT